VSHWQPETSLLFRYLSFSCSPIDFFQVAASRNATATARRICIYIQIFTFICVCVCVCVHIYVWIYVCTYVYAYVYIYVKIDVCVRVYAMYTYMYVCVSIYIKRARERERGPRGATEAQIGCLHCMQTECEPPSRGPIQVFKLSVPVGANYSNLKISSICSIVFTKLSTPPDLSS